MTKKKQNRLFKEWYTKHWGWEKCSECKTTEEKLELAFIEGLKTAELAMKVSMKSTHLMFYKKS